MTWGAELTPLSASVANHLLSRETWARERLAPHAGRTFEIAVGPFATTLAVESTGMLAAPPHAASAPDLKLRLSPFDVPSFLADPSRWDAFVTTEGDAALAATLADLAQTLPWFVERTFASALGPIVGQRVADAGRAMLAFPAYAAARVGDSVASYAEDEAAPATRRIDLRVFAEQVAALAARTDALATRIEQLAARANADEGHQFTGV
jgi:ubiquinone biosynthesis accessory factor UbiJ